MKKHLIIKGLLLALIVSVGMTACNNQTLESYVKEKQKTLPLEAGDGFTLVGCEIDNGYLVYMMTCDDQDLFEKLDVDYAEYVKNRDLVNQMYVEELCNAGNSQILTLCKKEGKGIKVLVTSTKSGRTITMIDMSSSEIPNVK